MAELSYLAKKHKSGLHEITISETTDRLNDAIAVLTISPWATQTQVMDAFRAIRRRISRENVATTTPATYENDAVVLE